MEKIIINGKVNSDIIKKEFAPYDVQFFFNIHPSSAKDINAFDAVFFINDSESNIAEWVGANHLRINETQADLLAEIKFYLGIPQKIEIERKFLIEHPNTDFLEAQKLCKGAEIAQCYISLPKPFRVRKRGLDGDYIYIRTEKKKISELVRTETERYITKEEYEKAIKGRQVLYKTRYLYVYKNQYFEIDVFPFWQDKALLEIELKAENEPYELPPFIKVIKEVTENSYYKNKQIALRHGVIYE